MDRILQVFPPKKASRLRTVGYGILLAWLFTLYFGKRLVRSISGRLAKEESLQPSVTPSERHDSRVYSVEESDPTDLPFGNVWRQMADSVPDNALVLDVGCSTGHLGRMLIKFRGCTVDGVEVDAAAGAIAGETYRTVWIEDLDSSQVGERIPCHEYDVALYMDVLEHLRDPGSLIEKLCPKLKGTGYTLASIPNVAYWQVRFELLRGRFNYTDIGAGELGILDPTHLRFFTIVTVKALFEENGYDVDWIAASFPDWHPFFSPLRGLRNAEDFRLNLLESFPGLLSRQFLIRARPRVHPQN